MPIAIRRSLELVVAASLLATMFAVLAPRADAHQQDHRTYRVTVENLTSNQKITPAVVATHDRRTHIFRIGRAASHGIQQLAENGGIPVLVDELEHTKSVNDVAVAGSEPIGPGESAAVLVTAPGGARRLSVAAMLICTNDGFATAADVRLPSVAESFFEEVGAPESRVGLGDPVELVALACVEAVGVLPECVA